MTLDPVSQNECGVLSYWRMVMKRIIIFSVFSVFFWIVFPITAFAVLPADVNNSGKIDLPDAILALQTLSRITVTVPVYTSTDVDGDGRIGMAEAIYVLQCLARLRNNHSPVLDFIGTKSIDEGSTLSFTISATDADNDPLTFAISPLPNGATLDTHNGTFVDPDIFTEWSLSNNFFRQ